MNYIIRPAQKISGSIEIPGDKSISHRALMIGAISEGETEIENLSNGADVLSTEACLKSLGVRIKKSKPRTVVFGQGLHGLHEPKGILNAGNSGTTIRLLAGILAGQQFPTTITGDESLRRRPMSRIIEPLRKMGAHIEAVDDEFAPLRIKGGNLAPVTYHLPVASAQVKSCLLLAGLYAEGTTEILEPAPTRDHTERMLQNFGASLEKDGLKIRVSGPARLQAQTLLVPGDLSSAAFFIAAAILVRDSELKIEKVGINPTRTAFFSLLNDMGANIDIVNFTPIKNEFMADLFIRPSKLKGIKVAGEIIPQIIDEIPILAVLATQAEGTTEIRDAQELRKKESDRLHAIAFNLKKMGARFEEKEDGIIIRGPVKLKGAAVESFGDHRIAMAFAIAGLIADKETEIKNAECVDVSFPGFFERLTEVSIV
jgi:3-phosphoshikimate 1-carboxyvinyltransferase